MTAHVPHLPLQGTSYVVHHRAIAGLYTDGASQDEITAAIWRTLLIGAYAAAGVR